MNQYEGQGFFIREDGSLQYEGGFSDGQYEGEGTLYGGDGSALYEGGFSQGLYQGEGRLYGEDHSLLYAGGFDKGLYSGDGALYRPDGKISYRGAFAAGCLRARAPPMTARGIHCTREPIAPECGGQRQSLSTWKPGGGRGLCGRTAGGGHRGSLR